MTDPTHGGLDLFRLLSPEGPRSFHTRHLGKRFLHSPGHRSELADLFRWEDLNRILATERLDPQRLKIVRAGRVTPFPLIAERTPQLIPNGSPRRLLGPEVVEQLDAGATLVMDAVEELHLPLRAFVQRIEQELRCLVQVNVYVSAGVTEGLALHWDDHDVFALQVAGRKRWRVVGPTLDQPVRDTAPPPRPSDHAPAVFDDVLEEGDILYVPRGWWHAVRAVGEPTIHLAVSARIPQALDLVHATLGRAAGTDQRLRDDIPTWATAEDRDEWLRQLATALQHALSPRRLAEVPLWADRPPVPARPSFALPLALGGAQAWEDSRGRSLRLRVDEVEPGLLAPVRRLATPGRKACDLLVSGGPARVDDLLDELATDELGTLTEALRQGAVELV